jgi:hypothetical protein
LGFIKIDEKDFKFSNYQLPFEEVGEEEILNYFKMIGICALMGF